MIKRKIAKELKLLIREYPVVTILGPRQAGKTTLVKSELKSYEYFNLEDPEQREFAMTDPKGFLKVLKNKKVIIDEIQRVPTLLSYIQVIVDEVQVNGMFVLTGSHQLELQQSVSQSLAGRSAILNLLPLSISELKSSHKSYDSFFDYCFNGFLPRVYSQSQRVRTAYANYYRTYVERDLKLLIKLKDLSLFEKFLKLLAGRVGQVIDYSSLANDVGVDAKTIKNWLSVLEASFIIYKLTPYYKNFGKRLIKSPKYYFIETGLLCYLLGIKKSEHVIRDPLVGSIFENLVVIEFLKSQLNKGEDSSLYFFRDNNKVEVDLLLEKHQSIHPIEIKSAATFNMSFLKNMKKIMSLSENIKKLTIVYSGDQKRDLDDYLLMNFKNIESFYKRLG